VPDGPSRRSAASCPSTIRRCNVSPAPTPSTTCWLRTAPRSVLDPFEAYLHRRWIARVTDAAALAKEITVHGYIVSEQAERRYLQQFRGMTTALPAPSTAPKVRPVTGWLLRRPSAPDTDKQQKLTKVRSRSRAWTASSGT
jgi:hypothetical protein